MREKSIDALIGATIKTVEELEALVSMLGAFGDGKEEPRRTSLASDLREIASLLDRLPLLANDLITIKRRLRSSLATDPDKTPRAVSLRDFAAVTPETETRLEPVEDQERRIHTRPGIGKPPLPKRRDTP
jgi:transposase InsO family protein